MSAVDELGQVLSVWDKQLAMDEGRLAQVVSDLETLLKEGKEHEAAVEQLTSLMGVFQSLEDSWHHSFEERLSLLISRGLTLVFGEPLDFVLEGKTHGDLSALEFKLVQHRPDGSELTTDILGAKGGGVIGVVSFLLRLLIILAMRPKLREILVLDETFAHLSAEYVPNMADLLRQLCDETGVQFVMITHEPAFGDVADVVYEVTQSAEGYSNYELLKNHREHVYS